jgi:hypothetical protein
MSQIKWLSNLEWQELTGSIINRYADKRFHLTSEQLLEFVNECIEQAIENREQDI